MLFFQNRSGAVRTVVTDRRGGVSEGGCDSLNLGRHVGDRPEAVEENRRRVADALGLSPDRVVYMDQCHSAEVAVVDAEAVRRPPRVDAVVTAEPDLALAVMVADCTPVLLWAQDAPVVAAAHAGRPGMAAGIVPATVARMREHGATRINALVGPSVCGRCYEVPADLRAEVAAVAPEAAAVSWVGTPALDVAAGVVAQLAREGVELEWVPGCSREHPDLFSYREDPAAGRYAGLIVRSSR